MTSTDDRNPTLLGHGVEVEEGDEAIEVRSREHSLPWRARTGPFVGTAVSWNGGLYEAVALDVASEGQRWRLESWPDGEAVRTTERLDRDRVAALAAEWRETERSRGLRSLLLLASPIVGALPARFQRRLELDHNLPAGRTTAISALFEILLGAWWMIAPGDLLVKLSGWVVFTEGMVRLWFSLTQDGPFASFVFAWMGVERAPPPTNPRAAGRARLLRRDESSGTIVLAADEPRTDWTEDGVLRFRDRLYRMERRGVEEDLFTYTFVPLAGENRVTLSFAPPPVEVTRRDRGRGLFGQSVRFILLGFAPGAVQRRLVPDLDLPVRTLTFFTASCELVGGLVDLAGGVPRDALTPLDFLFVIEGGYRLVRSAVTAQPVGSVLGWPFAGVFRYWMGRAAIDKEAADRPPPE